MIHPVLNVLETSKLMTGSFLGLDRRPRTNTGAFSDMENMTGDPYPLISSRKQRGLVTTLSSPQSMIAAGKIAYIDGSTLYYDYKPTPITDLSTAEADLPKQMTTMGAYVLVFPDGAYYNTVDATDYGRINRLWQTAGNVTYTLCQMDGTVLDMSVITVSKTAPEFPYDGDYWIDQSAGNHVLKRWNNNQQAWIGIATTYIRIDSTGIGKGLSVQDGVSISGISYSGEDETLKKQYNTLNGAAIVQACSDDYIVIVGLIDQVYTQKGGVRVDRKAPKMQFAFESKNRLWGCYHGVTEDGKTVNEIYASALGDFKNWSKYAGTSQDSYTVSVGAKGDFTGGINHLGNPYFFKERCVYKIYGEKPSNYQTQETVCDGVRAGCHETLKSVNGTLFYLSISGVCAFDTLPTDMAQPLGDETFDAGAAGEIEGNYYISMRGEDGKWGLYCLNTDKGTWHREDATHVLAFARMRDELYMLADDGRLMEVHGRKGEKEESVSWRIDSSNIGFEYSDQKYLSRFNIRMKLGQWARCTLYIEYDSSGVWERKGFMEGKEVVRTYTIPVIPRRCDHLKIRLEGEGEMQLYSIAKILEIGGDG